MKGNASRTATVEVWRGSVMESVHRVSVAVVDASGRLRAGAGDPELFTFARSAIKPFQALPLLEDGIAEAFGFSEREVALCCASHSGEAKHVGAAASMLRKIGADESALACGAHAPMHDATARSMRERREAPRRIHNNCSGKHAGMLALARHYGWPLAGYHGPAHPVQHRMLSEMARWMSMDAEDIRIAVDGCGVVTFAAPLTKFAFAFARLASAARRGETAAAGIVNAMTRNPDYVGGTGRLCTELMRVAGGRIVAKVGAEGVYMAGIPGAELGIALKVEDGAHRAAEPALIGVLCKLSLLSDEERAQLDAYAEPVIRNTRNEVVGGLRASMWLEPGRG